MNINENDGQRNSITIEVFKYRIEKPFIKNHTPDT